MIRAAVAARPLRLLAGLVLGLLAVLATPWSASAHAVLVSSDPANGSRLTASPSTVRMTFDEPIALVPEATVALSAAGGRVDRGPSTLSSDGRSLLLPLRADLPRGVYTVSWRVLSADSHIVNGSVRFGVGEDVAAATASAPTWTGVDTAAATAGGVVDAGVVLLVGVPVITSALWPSLLRGRRIRRITVAGGIAVIVGTVADLLLRGPRATGSGWAGLLALDDLGGTVGGVAGAVLLVRLLLTGALLAAVLPGGARAASTARSVAVAIAGVGVLGTVAALGHAADSAAAVWLVPVATLHLVGMAAWLGGLVVLVGVLLPRLRPVGLTRSSAVPAARVLQPWSRTAFAAVALMVATGEVQGLRTVAPLAAFWATGYGVLLVVKLLLVGLALLVALGAHRFVLPRGRRPSFAAFRRSVLIETAATAAVVAVTAALVMQPTAAESYGPPVAAQVPLGAGRIDVRVDSTRLGPTTIRLAARDGAGRAIPLESVSGSLSTDQVAGLDVTFRREGADRWISTDAQAPLPGRWLLTLQVSVDETIGYATSAAWTVW